MLNSLLEEDGFNNILEEAVEEYCEAEEELKDTVDIDAEMLIVDNAIDDDILDDVMTQEDIDIANGELLDDYETELAERDDKGDVDYAYDDALDNPFKDKVTVSDYLNDI